MEALEGSKYTYFCIILLLNAPFVYCVWLIRVLTKHFIFYKLDDAPSEAFPVIAPCCIILHCVYAKMNVPSYIRSLKL